MPRVNSTLQQNRLLTIHTIYERWHTFCARCSSTLIAVRSLLRGLPLCISSRPRTPLRVLCIVAFDTLHQLRNTKSLPKYKVRTLSTLLDLGACVNASFDNKRCCPVEYQETRRLLREAGIDSLVDEYLQRLKDLEHRRPLPGGDDSRFHEIRCYREAVARLSLGMVAATVNGNQSLGEGIRATACDADLNILWRTVMQCQLIDDVLDYTKDRSGGLPSFLTATTLLPQGLEFTRRAALGYADIRAISRTGNLFPMRAALFLVSLCAKLAIYWGRLRQLTTLAR